MQPETLQQLKDYVAQQKRGGVSEAELRELIKKEGGWSDEDLNIVFQSDTEHYVLSQQTYPALSPADIISQPENSFVHRLNSWLGVVILGILAFVAWYGSQFLVAIANGIFEYKTTSSFVALASIQFLLGVVIGLLALPFVIHLIPASSESRKKTLSSMGWCIAVGIAFAAKSLSAGSLAFGVGAEMWRALSSLSEKYFGFGLGGGISTWLVLIHVVALAIILLGYRIFITRVSIGVFFKPIFILLAVLISPHFLPGEISIWFSFLNWTTWTFSIGLFAVLYYVGITSGTLMQADTSRLNNESTHSTSHFWKYALLTLLVIGVSVTMYKLLYALQYRMYVSELLDSQQVYTGATQLSQETYDKWKSTRLSRLIEAGIYNENLMSHNPSNPYTDNGSIWLSDFAENLDFVVDDSEMLTLTRTSTFSPSKETLMFDTYMRLDEVFVTYDMATNSYLAHERGLFADNFEEDNNSWPLKAWRISQQPIKYTEFELPRGPWLSKFTYPRDRMECFSCGCNCYTSLEIYTHGDFVYVNIFDGKELVKPEIQGVYVLYEDAWRKIVPRVDEQSVTFSDDACTVLYSINTIPYELDVCTVLNISHRPSTLPAYEAKPELMPRDEGVLSGKPSTQSSGKDDSRRDVSINIISPLPEEVFVVGDTIPVRWNITNPPEDTRVRTSVTLTQALGEFSGYSGGSGSFTAVENKLEGTRLVQTRVGNDVTGIYEVHLTVEDCDPNGCNWVSRDFIPPIYATSQTVVYRLVPQH